MGDFFDDILGRGAAVADFASGAATAARPHAPSAGPSQYQKRRAPSSATRTQTQTLDSLFYLDPAEQDVASGDSSGDDDGGLTRRMPSGGTKRKRAPSSGGGGGGGPRKRQRVNMSPEDMCKFIFSQYYATGGNWIRLEGRETVKISNPLPDDRLCKAAMASGGRVATDEESVASMVDADDARRADYEDEDDGDQEALDSGNESPMDEEGGSGSRNPPSRPLHGAPVRGREGGARTGAALGLSPLALADRQRRRGPGCGQFNRTFAYEMMLARKIEDGTLNALTPLQMVLNSEKPISFNPVMHPVAQQELLQKVRRFRRDDYDPEHEDCPICTYGACDRQAAIAGLGGGSAISTFYMIYVNDRSNVNELCLYRSLAEFWNKYIYKPFHKIENSNGCEVHASHVEYHFCHCLEYWNNPLMITKELRETFTNLQTIRAEGGLYNEILTRGTRTGSIRSSPVQTERTRSLSAHGVGLGFKNQMASRSDMVEAHMIMRAKESNGEAGSFDGGNASFGKVMNQWGHLILHKKAVGSGNLL